MHSPCSLLAAAVLFALFISSPRCVFAQDNPATIINSIGMKLVLIPRGTFQMGAPFEEEFARDDEEPHEVTLSTGYYLGVTEVTQGQYEKVMGTNPAHFQKRVIRKSDSSMYPVERISWERAVEFCRKLSELPEEKAAGRVYGLPTEAEWEYACRAGSQTAYSSGETPRSLDDYAWIATNSKGHTHPVGEKKANAWGLFDMHGNVSEWCSDRYGEYPKAAVSDPVGPQTGSSRVYRGGSINDGAASCRSSVRFRQRPSEGENYIGFRVVLSPFGTAGAEDASAAMSRQKALVSADASKTGGSVGAGETTLMNIAGIGKSVVYLIDTSSSMDGPRLRTARAQLKASLRLLQPDQQFAVIFYNEYRVRLKLRRRAEEPMYYATDVNKQLAVHEIDRIASDSGTDHKPALLEALSLKPDVVYFLTDGDEPELSPADVRDIADHRNDATIHVIAFDDGSQTSVTPIWLQKLAQQGQGQYREIVAETP